MMVLKEDVSLMFLKAKGFHQMKCLSLHQEENRLISSNLKLRTDSSDSLQLAFKLFLVEHTLELALLEATSYLACQMGNCLKTPLAALDHCLSAINFASPSYYALHLQLTSDICHILVFKHHSPSTPYLALHLRNFSPMKQHLMVVSLKEDLSYR